MAKGKVKQKQKVGKANKAPRGRQLTAQVGVSVVGGEAAKAELAKLEEAAHGAVMRGVQSGVRAAMLQFFPGPMLVQTQPLPAKRGKARALSVSAPTPFPAPVAAIASTRPARRGSSRQRGSLEADARKVFDCIAANPDVRNEGIAKATGLDPRSVSAAIKWLKGFNVRGDVVRDALISLPEGDKRRYTTYRVVEGASFPENQPAKSDDVDLPADMTDQGPDSSPAQMPADDEERSVLAEDVDTSYDGPEGEGE